MLRCGLPALLVIATSVLFFFHSKPEPASSPKIQEKNQVKVIVDPPVEPTSGPLLRGAIYDRHYRELAVSYPLYSVRINPVNVKDPEKTATRLVEQLGGDVDHLKKRIEESRTPLVVADDLTPKHAEAINKLQLPGVVCTRVAHRYYPHHEIGAHVLGFTEDNLGLAGIESRFDQVLQPTVYQTAILPEISFGSMQTAGIRGTDLVLTIDLELQKLLTQRLTTLLSSESGGKVAALLLDIKKGDILALVSLPAFNPNYFWQTDDRCRTNRVITENIHPEAYRDLVVRAAAIAKSGELGQRLLPDTVAAPDYNLTPEQIAEFAAEIGLHDPIDCDLSQAQKQEPRSISQQPEDEPGSISTLNLLATIASLQNGGREIMPHLIAAVHDRETDQLFTYRNQKAESLEEGLYRVFSPALGVRMRLELFDRHKKKSSHSRLFTKTITRLDTQGTSHYLMQELLIALIPDRTPRYALLITRQHDSLLPRSKKERKTSEEWSRFCRSLVDTLDRQLSKKEKRTATFPQRFNRENYNRFLISRRMKVPPEPASFAIAAYEMPEVTGMSLRKGLQLLTGRNLFIRIRGTGRIVAQQPKPGTKLEGISECILNLEPPI